MYTKKDYFECYIKIAQTYALQAAAYSNRPEMAYGNHFEQMMSLSNEYFNGALMCFGNMTKEDQIGIQLAKANQSLFNEVTKEDKGD